MQLNDQTTGNIQQESNTNQTRTQIKNWMAEEVRPIELLAVEENDDEKISYLYFNLMKFLEIRLWKIIISVKILLHPIFIIRFFLCI